MAGCDLIASRSAKPSSSGIITSESTRSNGCAAMRSSASLPFVAVVDAPAAAQQARHVIAHVGVVVHHQDVGIRGPPPRARGASAASAPPQPAPCASRRRLLRRSGRRAAPAAACTRSGGEVRRPERHADRERAAAAGLARDADVAAVQARRAPARSARPMPRALVRARRARPRRGGSARRAAAAPPAAMPMPVSRTVQLARARRPRKRHLDARPRR